MYATVIPTLSLYRLRGIVLKHSGAGSERFETCTRLDHINRPVGELPASKEWFSIA